MYQSRSVFFPIQKTKIGVFHRYKVARVKFIFNFRSKYQNCSFLFQQHERTMAVLGCTIRLQQNELYTHTYTLWMDVSISKWALKLHGHTKHTNHQHLNLFFSNSINTLFPENTLALWIFARKLFH